MKKLCSCQQEVLCKSGLLIVFTVSLIGMVFSSCEAIQVFSGFFWGLSIFLFLMGQALAGNNKWCPTDDHNSRNRILFTLVIILMLVCTLGILAVQGYYLFNAYNKAKSDNSETVIVFMQQ